MTLLLPPAPPQPSRPQFPHFAGRVLRTGPETQTVLSECHRACHAPEALSLRPHHAPSPLCPSCSPRGYRDTGTLWGPLIFLAGTSLPLDSYLVQHETVPAHVCSQPSEAVTPGLKSN